MLNKLVAPCGLERAASTTRCGDDATTASAGQEIETVGCSMQRVTK